MLKKYPKVLIGPEGLEIKNKELLDLKIEKFPKKYFEGVKGYNTLMLSEEFYQRFILYEFILIYQLDAFVFSDRLDEFCQLEFDYIGAPWIQGVPTRANYDLRNIYVGNGGLSLRKTNAIYTYLTLQPVLEDVAEDVFFSSGWRELKIAPVEVAISFSIEMQVKRCFELNGNQLPFGCHAWEKFNCSFWRPFIESAGYIIDESRVYDLDETEKYRENWFLNYPKEKIREKFNKIVPKSGSSGITVGENHPHAQ